VNCSLSLSGHCAKAMLMSGLVELGIGLVNVHERRRRLEVSVGKFKYETRC
jgi:hypothetical protein